uniref:Uncharacterized protein n=1 Tax=Knipowitschia caucasica TaxID=637954 RepID=A0AAV2J6Y7_KNICA
MVLVPHQEYPMVCTGVSPGACPLLPLSLHYINLNSNTSWFTDTGLERPCPDVVQVKQIDSSSLLVLFNKCVYTLGLEGELKSQSGFSEDMESVVCVGESLVAVWSHGWQRRRLHFPELLQEVTDHNKTFCLLPSDRLVLLQTRKPDQHLVNLYLLEEAEHLILRP